MKSILQYGQTVNKANKGKADNLDVFQSGVQAMREGYSIKAFERITTDSGLTFIRKRKGSK